jgi:hypothetical protein
MCPSLWLSELQGERALLALELELEICFCDDVSLVSEWSLKRREAAARRRRRKKERKKEAAG